MKSLKNKLTLIFCLFTLVSYSQGYNGKRFVFNYTPAYSIIMINGIIISQYFVHHHKLELGASFGRRIFFSVNAEYSKNFNIDDIEYVHDNTVGATIHFFVNRKGCFTPVGKYIAFGINYGFQYSTVGYEIQDNYGSTNYEFFNEKKESILGSLYTGQNYVIFNRLFLGYGIQWGVALDHNSTNVRHFGKPYFKLGICF